MPIITQLSNGPDLRFATEVKQGDRLTIEFGIQGQAALVGHSWRAQLRGRAGRLMSGFGISVSTYTVTTPNDSLWVAIEINGAGTAVLRPGVYLADCEDLTTEHTWASATVEILRDWSR